MQKSANPLGTPRQGATRQEAQLHPLRSHRRMNTARLETPKQSKPSQFEYDSPPPPSRFSLKLNAETTMLLGAGEAEDRVILKGMDRIGLMLWDE